MPTRRPLSKNLVSLLLAGGLALTVATGCKKSNSIDVDNGDLPAGSKCTSGPNDPCAGTCFQGICRLACGPNRECPSGQTCFGDGAGAVCAPAGSLGFDLLTDCTDGCKVDLLPFAREGYFRTCSSDGIGPTTLYPADATSPGLDPQKLCPGTIDAQLAVKDEVLYNFGFQASPPICTNDNRPIGVVGDSLVAHTCTQDSTGEYVSNAKMGRLIDAGGKTYLVMAWSDYGDLPEYADSSTEYGLYEFSPEAVSLPCPAAPPPLCDKPTFPPVGGAVSGFDGLWAECDWNAPGATGCFAPTPENAEAALPTCPTDYATWDQGGYLQSLYVRPDGYGAEGVGPDGASCFFAFRESNNGRLLELARAHAPVGMLVPRYVEWKLVTATSGETMLWRRDPQDDNPATNLCHSAGIGTFFKKVDPPAGFKDPCDSSLPDFTF